MCISGEKIVNILSTFLGPIIAAVVAYIAVRQYKLAKIKMRIALFDRRNKVFETVMEFLSGIVQKANVTNEELHKLLRESRESYILFKEDISVYINELYKKAIRLQFVRVRLDDEKVPDGEERTKLAQEEYELLGFFEKQFDVTREKFKKYLDLGMKF